MSSPDRSVSDGVPIDTTDPINARILAVSEDRLQGYPRDPIGEIARLADLPTDVVLERLRAMLAAGVIRRIRQTLLATSLAEGALCAWQVPTERLDSAFEHLFHQINAAARTVEFVAEQLIGRAGCGAEPAVDAFAQDSLGFAALRRVLNEIGEIGLHK